MKIVANSVPYGGKAMITPNTGTAMVTNFSIITKDWAYEESNTLTAYFGYKHKVSEETNKKSFVWLSKQMIDIVQETPPYITPLCISSTPTEIEPVVKVESGKGSPAITIGEPLYILKPERISKENIKDLFSNLQTKVVSGGNLQIGLTQS